MTDKLTDSEIVKVLEDALYRIKGAEHLIVPKEGVDNLCNGLENALDLINRLQAKLDEAEDTIQFADKELKKAEAEVERLKYCNETNISSIATLHEQLKTAKSEAYKEFAERLKEFMHNKFKALDEYEFEYITERDIDNLVKERVGEDNASTNK